MDKPKLGDKPYKKIVPLKGRFLAKLKNEFKKELSRNDLKEVENGVNDTINNNAASKSVPTFKEPLKSPDNKIIIQKVENVKIELIKNAIGPARRLSSLFKESKSELPESPIVKVTATIPESNDVIQPAIDEVSPEPNQNGIDDPQSSIKLLSAKIPDNNFNKAVPLKLTRIIRKPKPQPNLRQRFHRVETFQQAETKPAPEQDAFDFSLVKIEVLMPDIEMREDVPIAFALKNVGRTPNEMGDSEFEPGPVLLDSSSDKKDSDGDDDFRGFENNDLMNSECSNQTLHNWITILKQTKESIDSNTRPSKSLQKSFNQLQIVNSSQKLALPIREISLSAKKIQPVLAKSTLKVAIIKNADSFIGMQPVKIIKSPEPVKQVKEIKLPFVESPKEIQWPILTRKVVSSVLTGVPSSSSSPVQQLPISNKFEPVAIKISSPPLDSKKTIQFRPSTSQALLGSPPSSSEGFFKREKKEAKVFEKMNAGWQDDILAVIGASRIAEIDKTLKDIPNIMTGNVIDMENVEQKLIINHLLRLLNVNSVMETLQLNSSSSFLKDSTDDDSDDFPDSSEGNSNGPSNYFDPTTEDSVDASGYDDDHDAPRGDNPSEAFHTVATNTPDNNLPSFVLDATLSPEYVVQKKEPSQVTPTKKSDSFPQVILADIIEEHKIVEDVPVDEIFTHTVYNNDNRVNNAITRSTNRKRQKESTPPLDNLKKAKGVKRQALHWSLLVDGSTRRSSLRGSSRESSVELPRTPSPSAKQPKKEENVKKAMPQKVKTVVKIETPQKLSVESVSQTPSPTAYFELESLTTKQNVTTPTKLAAGGDVVWRSLSRLASRESSTEKKVFSRTPPPMLYYESEPLETKPSLTTPKKLTKVETIVCRSSDRLASRESSAERATPPSSPLLRKSKIAKLNELDSSDSGSGPGKNLRRSDRVRQLMSSSDDSDAGRLAPKKISSDDDSDTPLVKKKLQGRPRKNRNLKEDEAPTKNIRTKRPCKILDSESDLKNSSDIDSIPSRNIELKSRLNPSDSDSNSNSKHKSSILIRKNYFTSPDKRKVKDETEMSRVVSQLTTTIDRKKQIDPSYVTPPTITKRERLRTSAFKGNFECSNDEDIQSTAAQPSVSRGSSVTNDQSESSRTIQERMKDMIEDQKKKISPKKTQEKVAESRKCRPKNLLEVLEVTKKVFVQEPLETAIEKLVPYNEILQAIKVSEPSKKGRGKSLNKIVDEKREENLKALQALKFFRCGACEFNVTKHRWLDHFHEHGGMAWIDEFEPPIRLEEWNEAVRRTNNNIKTYNLSVLKCPHCYQQKISALGHLSHLLICGESLEEIELKKINCELCDVKYLPCNASQHRSKCPGHKKFSEADDGDDENDKNGESDEDMTPESFNSSGRLKRKAVKKAEKKNKKVFQDLLHESSNHLLVENGHLKCQICGDSSFQSKDKAIDHVRQHDASNGFDDFDASDSDVTIEENESTDETEGSSGVLSSEIESSEDEAISDNDESCAIVSSKKGKPSNSEPPEVKYGRTVMSDYVELLRDKNITTKTIRWTKEFVDGNWKAEVLARLVPKFNLTLAQDVKKALSVLKFNKKSMKFGVKQVTEYLPTFETQFKKEWDQLEICDHSSDSDSTIIYCGGSISSLDWAPTCGDLNFLAVACNNNNHGITLNLTDSSKSCVQLYEFKELTNDKFKGFTDLARLCYVFIVNDGPIWSIKFHPSESPIEKRVGLLAVTSANQSVLIYSLPYLNNNKSIILPLEPVLICKLEQSDILYNEEFLLQASRVAWYQKNDSDCILAAGFISGLVAVWNINSHELSENTSKTLLPHFVIQAHLEPVTALDFKATTEKEFHLLTASLDRKMKFYTLNDTRCQEIADNYAMSRVLCAQWWLNWPGYLVGLDDCFTFTSFLHRQPVEFGMRNSPLLGMHSSIIHLNINHWLNYAMVVTESGDVIGCQPQQMLQNFPKDKWSYFKFNVHSYTDFRKISGNESGADEIAVVFCDIKDNTRQPKKFRLAPTERINELQINQVCFNRNETSYRFYALGYETGFVRIRYLKNSK